MPNTKLGGSICILLLILCLSLPLAAEEQPFVPAYLLSYPQSAYVALQQPFQWKTAEWIWTAAALGTGTALYLLDEEINAILQRNHTPLLDDISYAFKQFGEGIYVFPLTGGTVLLGYLTGSDKTVDTGLLCLKSLLIGGAVTTTLKYATQRQRPVSGNGNSFWNGEGFTRRRDSFPSGHATLVWSVAPILAHQYRETRWVAPLAYSVASLTALSRAYDNRHWPTDVFAAGVVGYLAARLTLISTPRLQVHPDPASGGIGFVWEF